MAQVYVTDCCGEVFSTAAGALSHEKWCSIGKACAETAPAQASAGILVRSSRYCIYCRAEITGTSCGGCNDRARVALDIVRSKM